MSSFTQTVNAKRPTKGKINECLVKSEPPSLREQQPVKRQSPTTSSTSGFNSIYEGRNSSFPLLSVLFLAQATRKKALIIFYPNRYSLRGLRPKGCSFKTAFFFWHKKRMLELCKHCRLIFYKKRYTS